MAIQPLQGIFIVVGLATLIMAIGAVTARNLFHALLFLVGSFVGVVVLYFLLEAEFLAVVQAIIYIGAISTLIVFAIMLTRSVMGKNAGAMNRYAPALAFVAIALFAALAWLLYSVQASFNVTAQAVPADAIAQIGEAFVGPYIVPFEAASVMLLVALIGAIMLARERH